MERKVKQAEPCIPRRESLPIIKKKNFTIYNEKKYGTYKTII